MRQKAPGKQKIITISKMPERAQFLLLCQVDLPPVALPNNAQSMDCLSAGNDTSTCS